MSYQQGNQRQEYDNNGVAFFRNNDKKKSDKSPDMWAYMEMDGRRYKGSAWYLDNRRDQTKPCLKIVWAPAQAQAQQGYNQAQAQMRPQQNQGYQQGYQGGPAQPPRRFDQRMEAEQEQRFVSQEAQRPLTQNQGYPPAQYNRDYGDNKQPPF